MPCPGKCLYPYQDVYGNGLIGFLVASINDKKESFYSTKEDKDEQKEFETGPLSILMNSVKQNTQVLSLPGKDLL